MIRLLFIVPYPELEDKVEYVAAYHPESQRLNTDVRVMTMEDTLNVPADQYDAITIRGYSALKTSTKHTRILTIGLFTSGHDAARAISECYETYHSKKIAICGFSGQTHEIKGICRLFKTGAEVYAPISPEELPITLKRAKAAGCDTLIGRYSANILTRWYNIPSVIVRTGEDMVLQTLDETLHTMDQIRQERIIPQMHKTIICSSEDSLPYVDSGGVIKVHNWVVRQMNGDVSLMNQPLRQVLLYLHKMFLSVAANGQGETGQIPAIPETKVTVFVSCTPVITNNEMSEVIFNPSDTTTIQDLESQIRCRSSERDFQAKYTFDDIIYQSSIIHDTMENTKRYADSDSNIITVGETGMGKELFAQSIHDSSQRKDGPFVMINCAALPENLLESEPFGCVGGTFTGTSKGGKMRLFKPTHEGTLFLDEVREISLSTQSKPLRALQERQVRRVGDNKVADVNVHIISAIDRNIGKLSEQGLFRGDLMYRPDVLRLFLPPPRMRKSDVESLFLHLLNAHSRGNCLPVPRLETGALTTLHNHPFIGNIRKLKNIVECTCMFKTGDCITKQSLQDAPYPPDLDGRPLPAPAHFLSDSLSLDEPERPCLALEQSEGSRAQAARTLGMDRSTLWRKMKKCGS